MYAIDFRIEGQTLRLPNGITQQIVANSVGYLQSSITFETPNDWTGLYKYVEYKYANKNYLVPLTSTDLVGDAYVTYVPYQVIKAPGFAISVFGTDTVLDTSEEPIDIIVEKQLTTTIIKIDVVCSGELFGLFAGDENDNEVSSRMIALQAAEDAAEAVEINNELREEFTLLSQQVADVSAMATDYSTFKAQTIASISADEQILDTTIVSLSEVKATADAAAVRIITKEDTDFIEKKSYNLVTAITQASLDVTTGTIVPNQYYICTNDIWGTGGFCSNISSFTVCYYYGEIDDVEPTFITSMNVRNGVFIIPNTATMFRASAVGLSSMMIRTGTVFDSNLYYYDFDDTLVSSIVRVIDSYYNDAIDAQY